VAFETHGSEGWGVTEAAAPCGDHTDADLDSIFLNWQFLGAVAWRGYQALGCGTVVVDVSDERVAVSYAGGALPETYTRFVERYDPLEELVIVVRHATGEHVYLLSGRPSPQACTETGSAHPMYGNLHAPSVSVIQ
jgi:hypothetical protein